MKPLSSFLIHLALSVCCLSGCCLTASGQSDEYYAKAGEASRGYWSLNTDYATRCTRVRFFDADSQLVYQESLPNQFIRLTPANVRRLDQTLDRLVASQLLSSSIETTEIPLETRMPRRPSPTVAETEVKAATPNTPSVSGLSVRYHPSYGKPGVYLFIQNPAQQRVTVTVRSEENVILYEQITRLEDNRLFLNMSGMPAGTYQVRVQSATKQIQKAVAVSYSSRTAGGLVLDR